MKTWKLVYLVIQQVYVGIRLTNTKGDTSGNLVGRIVKNHEVVLDKDMYYFKFIPDDDYTYLHIYIHLKHCYYTSISVYNLTENNFYQSFKANINNLEMCYNAYILQKSGKNKVPVPFLEDIVFGFGNISGNGSISNTLNALYSMDYLKFEHQKVSLEFDNDLFRMKLFTFDENQDFLEKIEFTNENIEFTANPDYFYRIVFAYQDSNEHTIDFNSPINEGLLKIYYIVGDEQNAINKKLAIKMNQNKLFCKVNSLKYPRLYAHRGYQAEAPENSIPAFELAGRYGFWGIETDLYATSDNVVVCMHDETINRMTDGTGNIADLTYEELCQYHIDTGTNVEQYTIEQLKIPTIDDYLSICRYYGLIPFIELKTDIVELVVQKLKDYGLEDYAIMSSFDWDLITKTRNKSNMYVHWIKMDTSDTHVDDLELMQNAGRSFNYTDLASVPSNLNPTMNNKGVGYCFRAADTVADVKKQIELGVSYIPTNTIKPSELL